MALRTWSRVLLAALAVATAAGAGQLGLAYGLGIVRFARGFLDGAEAQWHGQLAWVAWFAMLAAVIGGLAAERMAGRHGQVLSLGGRAGVSAVAALGAAVVAPLTMQPARAAQIAPAVDPVLTVGLTAVMGAVVGGVVAAAVLILRPVRWNVIAVSGAVWGLALLSVAPSLGPRDPLPTVRLGVLDLPSLAPGTTRALALIGIPALALLAGAATAGLARWLGDRQLVVMAACGAAGPGLLALAYVLAGPGGAAQQTAPYWAALIGLAAGLLGSVLLAVVPAPGSAAPADSPVEAGGSADEAGAPGDPDTSAPTVPSGAARPGDEPAVSTVAQLWPDGDPFSSTAERQPGGREAPAPAVRRDEPALTDPTPDPLTAPIEQLKLGRRPRPRPARSPAAQASSPTPPAEPAPAEQPRTQVTPTPATPTPVTPARPPARSARRVPEVPPPAAEPPPVVPEPALKEIPAEALQRPDDPPARGGWRSLRRQRRTATDAPPTAATSTDAPTTGAPTTAATSTADTPPAAPAAEAARTARTRRDKSTPAAEPAAVAEPAEPAERSEAGAEPARRSRFGLRRRGDRGTSEQRRPAAEEKLDAGDEEYVDWVSGLGGTRKRDKT